MINKIKEKLRYHFHEVLKAKKSPHSIALGFAIGTFIGILPTPGFNIILGLLVVLIYERISKLSLFGAIAFWNPITQIPIYALSFKIGDMILGKVPSVDYEVSFLYQAFHFSSRYLLGNFILAVGISILSYFIVKEIARFYYKRKQEKEDSP